MISNSEALRNITEANFLNNLESIIGTGVAAVAVSPTNSLGKVTVTTAGTAVQLSSSSVPCKGVLICTDPANTAGDLMYVGYAANKTGDALTIYKTIYSQGAAADNPDFYFKCDNLNEIWVDSDGNSKSIIYRIV